MTELIVEQRLDRLEYFVRVECAHCKESTPLSEIERIKQSDKLGVSFQGAVCWKCLKQFEKLEQNLRDDAVHKLWEWFKSKD